MTAAEQRKKDVELRSRIRRLFSENLEVRQDAIEALKNAWGYHAPSFEVTELATMPAENCTIMAAKRDGYKEVIDWLTNL